MGGIVPPTPRAARLIRLSIATQVCSMGRMGQRYIVNLTRDERAGLEGIVSSRASAVRRQRARILLLADTEKMTDLEIADEVGAAIATVERLRKRCCLEGIEAA